MIEQHYYTRERKGIYSRTPGYDTVAKSKNLEDDFIINTLHDLCFYEISSSLAGDEEISKYPVSMFCVNTEDNRMILGQSVFCGKDYTGQRNRYFTHNYIIPEEERNEYIENPEKIIFPEGFVGDYNIDKGVTIPQVLKIKEKTDQDCFNSIEDMFAATKMCRETFLNLIKASFDVAKYKKNIYIVLDSEDNTITTLAKGILKYLYRVLPFEIRRKIGFITYMKEPRNKNLINIIFLCKGSIKRITTEIKSGYVFDVAENSFHLEGIDEGKHVFLNFVMDNIENKERLNKFFYKAEEFIDNNKLSIYNYDNLLNPLPRHLKETLVKDKNKKNDEQESNIVYDNELKEIDNERSIYDVYKKIKDFIVKIKNRFIA